MLKAVIIVFAVGKLSLGFCLDFGMSRPAHLRSSTRQVSVCRRLNHVALKTDADGISI